MKKTALMTVAAAVSVLSSGVASAADLPPAPQPYKAAAVAAVYNWTGFYIGANGGWAWGNQDPLVLFSNNLDRQSFSISGGVFGGTVGAQIQQGYVVLGLEGDLDWADIKGTAITTPTILGQPAPFTLNVASKISALGTARLRAGVAVDNWLFYTTGGVALADVSANGTSLAGVPCGTLGVLPNCSGSAWRPGITAGLGVEWGFTHNLSLKTEYLYTVLVGSGVSTDKMNVVRTGINFKF